MGAAESRADVTPIRPYNRHLSRVTDPRSPTAGIMRTPIEVGDTPKRALGLVQDEVLEPTLIADPRSPSHGIVRTPLRPSLHDSLNHLAKQLSEVFVSEDPEIEESPAADVEPPAASPEEQAESEPTSTPAPTVMEAEGRTAEEAEGRTAEEAEGRTAEEAEGRPAEEAEGTAEESPVVQAAALAEATPTVQQPQKQRGRSPHGSGSKNIRQRPRKALTSTTPGRSPLKILQEDNSPSAAVQNRSVKKISFQSEPTSSRMLKISHNSWEMCYNKENTHYTQSES